MCTLSIIVALLCSSQCLGSVFDHQPSPLTDMKQNMISNKNELEEENYPTDEDLNYHNGPEGDRILDIPIGIPDDEKNVPGEHLTPEDFENAKQVELLVPVMDEYSPDPIQSAGLFEGDIAGVNITDTSQVRNAIKSLIKRWGGGVVPYAISSAFNIYERSVIAAAVLDYHERTCIHFIPRTTQRDYIYLIKGSGCSSQVGRTGGGQEVSLGSGCIYKGVIIHELMHALGFWHEQSRPDRDNYVTVLWQNIIRGMEYNFQRFSWETLQTLGVPYDTSSVMHYTSLSFSKDGRSPTIVPRQPGVQFIGQRIGFSEVDVLEINRLYECPKTENKPTIISPIVPVPDGKCRDNNNMCSYWASIGECLKNSPWMLVNCKKSCKQCSEDCTNNHNDCEYWSGIGECTKNPSYMTINCARSCKTCKDNDGTTCKNYHKKCDYWSRIGECQKNPSYMTLYCARSCQTCNFKDVRDGVDIQPSLEL